MAESRVEAALAQLGDRDPVLALLIQVHGPSTLGALPESGDANGHFAALVRAVLYQQLAGKAAAAIHGRVQAAAAGSVTAASMLEIGYEGLRQCGLSGAKATTILALAEAVTSGTLDLGTLDQLDGAAVIAALCDRRGIGPWTAHMFCMFRLGRLDVWPVGDYGVRKGYAIAWGLAEPPSAKALEPLGERFRPWRSLVAWYCWRAVEGPLPGW